MYLFHVHSIGDSTIKLSLDEINCKYFNFSQLLPEMTNHNNLDHHVILLGDMNGCLGNRLVYIKYDNDTDENLPLPETMAF